MTSNETEQPRGVVGKLHWGACAVCMYSGWDGSRCRRDIECEPIRLWPTEDNYVICDDFEEAADGD